MKQTFLAINNQINGYSIALTVALDLLWNFPDSTFILYWLLAPFIFVFCAASITLIQRNLSYDEWGPAITKGLVLGFIAALPFSVITTVAGAIFGAMQLQYGNDQDVLLLGQLTKAWGELEKVLKSPFQPAQLRGLNIEQVIDMLCDHDLVSPYEKNELHRLRMARNKIVHDGQENPPSIDELSGLVQKIGEYSQNLSRRLNA